MNTTPPMSNSILAAQMTFFDELRNRVGHTRESAIEITQQIVATELFDRDGHVDPAAVAEKASRYPVTDDPAPDDHGSTLTALILAHAMVTGDLDIPAAVLPSDVAALRTLSAAQAWLTDAVLRITTPGREVELLRHLHDVELTAIAAGAE